MQAGVPDPSFVTELLVRLGLSPLEQLFLVSKSLLLRATSHTRLKARDHCRYSITLVV